MSSSKTAVAERRRRKGRRSDGGFFQVHRNMTRSPAFRSLSPRAGWLLIGLMDRFQGSDNRIPMSLREAKVWLKSGTDMARKAFTELEDKGFIKCVEQGGFTRKTRHASVWQLGMFGRGGQKATLDFEHYEPPAELKVLGVKNKTRYLTQVQDGTSPRYRDSVTVLDAGAAGGSHGTYSKCRAVPDAGALLYSTSRDSPPDVSVPIPPARDSHPGGDDGDLGDLPIVAPVNLVERLQAAIRGKGWTHAELADLAGTHRPTVSQIVRGELARVSDATAARVLLVAENHNPPLPARRSKS